MPHSRLDDLPNANTRWPNIGSTGYKTVQWGDMEVGLTTLDGPLDCTNNYVDGGLPGGVCPCPHYGYIFKGRMRAVYPGTDWPDEVIEEGEAYFIPAGHVLKYEHEDGCRILELNPHHALQMCMDAMNVASGKRRGLPVEEMKGPSIS